MGIFLFYVFYVRWKVYMTLVFCQKKAPESYCSEAIFLYGIVYDIFVLSNQKSKAENKIFGEMGLVI